MSNFDKIKIKLSFGCGYTHKQEDEELLSDYWSEDEWNSLSNIQKDRWLDDFWIEWKCNYETGGAYLDYGE